MGQVIYMAEFKHRRAQPTFPNTLQLLDSPQTTEKLGLSLEILSLEMRIANLRDSIPTFATVTERENVVLRMLALGEKMALLREQLKRQLEG
jgi:hypothetical protein